MNSQKPTQPAAYDLPILAELEAEAIDVMREAAGQFAHPAMIHDGTVESSCLSWLAQKAFSPGAVPFALVAEQAALSSSHDALIDGQARNEALFFRNAEGEPGARPQLWDLYNGRLRAGERAQVMPLATWSALDLRRYAATEAVLLAGARSTDPRQDLLRLVLAGSAGSGKSTLHQRLLEASAPGEAITSPAGGTFGTRRRRFVVADTVAGEGYAPDAIASASRAQLAVVLVDAERGLQAQTRRHAFMASLLGIPRVVVVVNKMDRVGYAQDRLHQIRGEFEAFAARLAFKNITFIPTSALRGDNIVQPSAAMPWYAGEPLLGHLENVYIGGDRNLVDFRFPVQGAVDAKDGRWYLGRVESGVVKPGDEIIALPSRRRTRVRAVRLHERPLEYAYAPLSVALALEEDLDLGRGAMLAHARNLPRAVRSLDSMVAWMGEQPLSAGRVYLLRHGTSWVRASCAEVTYRMDAESLHRTQGDTLSSSDVGRASFTLFEERFVDSYLQNRAMGGFIVVDPESNATVGAGMIIERESEAPRVEPGKAAKRIVVPHASKVSVDDRAALLGQSAVTVWLTGLSGAGKSTLATELERHLVGAGRACYMLDGDNVRTGINRDLGFGPDDRRENIRRIAEVARLMNDAGLIIVTAFISPYRADREMARTIIGAEHFVEVFVDASLQVCESRDPKGLYRKARKGEIPEFTGISAPYEAPVAPALALDTGAATIADCVQRLMDLILQRAGA